jgi:ubiquinone biosynthesis protein
MGLIRTLYFLKNIYAKKVPDIKKIENIGLLAVKIGQHYALRVDFLDEKVCTELSKLYTHSFKSKSGEDFEKLITSYSGKDYFKNFSYVEKKTFYFCLNRPGS